MDLRDALTESECQLELVSQGRNQLGLEKNPLEAGWGPERARELEDKRNIVPVREFPPSDTGKDAEDLFFWLV
jgi:hypothetical protein